VTLAARLAGKTAAETISVMLAIFARIKPALRKSITFDNDTAFAQHGLLQSMRAMATWFCDAYASWQKGGVENANGRLRRWLPRHIDIDRLSDGEIQDIVITRRSSKSLAKLSAPISTSIAVSSLACQRRSKSRIERKERPLLRLSFSAGRLLQTRGA
jgi:hypothetical protein